MVEKLAFCNESLPHNDRRFITSLPSDYVNITLFGLGCGMLKGKGKLAAINSDIEMDAILAFFKRIKLYEKTIYIGLKLDRKKGWVYRSDKSYARYFELSLKLNNTQSIGCCRCAQIRNGTPHRDRCHISSEEASKNNATSEYRFLCQV